MNRKLIKQWCKNERGSALVTVFMVLIVLLALGMGVMALSVGGAKQSVVTDTFEKLYYPAEGASTQGVEFIKQQVLNEYQDIADLFDHNNSSTNNQTTFFQHLNDRLGADGANFAASQPDQSAGSAVDALDTKITHTSSGSTYIYTVSSKATGGSTARGVDGKLKVTFVKLEKKFIPFGEHALIVGNTLDFTDAKPNTTITASGGVEVATINPSSSASKISGGIVAPPPGRDLDWDLSFSSFSAFIGLMGDNTHALVPGSYTMGTGNNKVSFSNALQNITTASLSLSSSKVTPAITNYLLNNVNVTSGAKLVSYGKLGIEGGTIRNAVIVTSGDLHLDGTTIYDSAIYCGGTLYLRDGNSKDTNVVDTVIYANNVNIGGNGNGKYVFTKGLLYSKNDITIEGNKVDTQQFSYSGQVVAKGDVIVTEDVPNKELKFRFDESILNNLPAVMYNLNVGSIIDSPFIESLTDYNGGTLYTIIYPTFDQIFQDQSVQEN